MITIKINKILFLVLINLIYFNFSCNKTSNNSFIENTLNEKIDSLLNTSPKPNFITVYFSELDNADYIFITPHLSLNETQSSFYYKRNGKYIIFGFCNNRIEKKYAYIIPEKETMNFNFSDNNLDLYDRKQMVFKIIKKDKIVPINPSNEILLLNNFGHIKFIEPIKE